jgi:MoaA/NifB/PqqE/SkfB family radical SAM enzyme
MNYLQQIRNYTLSQVISGLVGALGNSSDQNLIRMTYLAEKVAQKDYYRRQIRRIRSLFESQHPALTVAKRIMQETNPLHRRKLVECFIINQLLVGTNKRKEFSESPGGFYPPGLFVLSPTMRCNLHCYGCYSGEYSREQDLPYPLMDRVLKEGKEMGIYFVVVSGGEPFLHPNLFDLFAAHNDVAFMIYTHGGLLNEKTVERLTGLGNVLPCISIEGFEEETDARRGAGHYAKVERAMDLLREAGILFAFSATLTRQNADLILSDRFLDHYIEKGVSLGWYFIYMPIGREPKMDLMPTPEQRNQLRERVKYFREAKPILLGDFMGDGAVVGGCIAGGRKYFHINSQGDIEPCVFCHYAVDNIRDKSLKEALSSPFFRYIRGQIPYNENLYRPCMLVDKPEVSRSAIQLHQARPTHQGAEVMFGDLASEIDQFSSAYARISDPIWEEEREKIKAKDQAEKISATMG